MSKPILLSRTSKAVVAPGQAQVVDDTEITIEQEPARAFIFDPGVELSDVVDAINAVGASPADLVASLKHFEKQGLYAQK